MKRTIGLAASILLHVAVLIAFLWKPPVEPPTPPPPAGVLEVHLIPMQKPTAPKPVLPEGDGTGYTIVDPVICEGKNEKYKGIGIIHGIGTGYVTEIPEQYPAYKAGIRMFDRIISLSNEDDRMDYVEVVVERDGKELTFHIRKDTICFQREPEPNP